MINIQPKKWQSNGSFCQMLLKNEYAKRDSKGAIKPILSEGLVIYMYEAYRAGFSEGISEGKHQERLTQ